MGFLKKLLKGAAVVGGFLVPGVGWWGVALVLAGTVINKLKKWLTPDMPDKQAMLIQRIGSDYAIPVVYGTRKVGAIIVDRAVSNEPGGLENEVYHVFCVFSQGEIDSYVEFFFNGVSWNDARWTKNGLRYYNYQLATGTPEQNPLTAGTVFNRWSSTQSHYRGIATAIFSFRQDKDGTIWNGEPQITAVIKGKKCLDLRTSATEYTENPAIHLYDYLRSTVYGLGMTDADIDLASVIAVANICDTNETATVDTQICQTVDGVYTCTGGPAEVVNFKRFTHNNIIDTGRTLFDNVSEIANSYRGFFPDSDGRLKIGTEIEGNPVFSFNADNIVSSITSTLPGIKDRFNRVVVRFPNVENKYEMDECFYPATDDPLYAQWLEEDNGLNLEKVITAEYTVYKAEALQLAEVAVKASRNAESVQFTATPEALQLDVGDIIDITEENRGWINKEFRVAATEYREDYLVNITAIQHDDAIYPWSDLDYSEIIGGTNLGDPANIPAPTGLAITPDPTLATRGTLTWNYGQNAFVRRFLVVLLSGTTELERTETVGQSYVIPQIDSGSYSIQVRAISTIGFPSEAASISFTLALPVPPTSITTIVANFDITAIPVLAGIGLGTTFEFAIGSTSQVVGRGASMVFAGLLHGTEYTVYARTVNALGVSTWASTVATTTSDGTNIVDLIGGDIAAQVFGGVVAEVNAGLQGVVDASLVDYSTTIEVNQLITDRIDEVNDAIGEDPRVTVLDILANTMGNFETGENLRTETKERVTVTTAMQAQINQNAASIVTTNQVVADLTSATATSINTLITATGNNTASITNLQQTVTDLDSAVSTDIIALQSQVGDNTADIIIVNQTVADLDSATATSIATLTAAVDDNEAAITTVSTALATETSTRASQVATLTASVGENTAAIITANTAIATETNTRATQVEQLQADDAAIIGMINEVESDVSGNATAISALQGTVNNPTTGVAATYTLANTAKTTADGAASSVSSLTNTVNNPTTGLSATNTLAAQAKTTADGAALAASTVTGTVNNPATGLAATYSIANAAQSTADDAASSATSVTNTVNNPTTGLAATATIANGAQTTANGALTAVNGLKTAIAGPGNEASAALILETTFDPAQGFAFGRAFLGVSSTTGGVTRVTGIVADGATNTLEFRADTLRLSDTAGTVQLYWDTGRNKWIYTGDIVAATFQTATSGYRAEMSGSGSFPLWYGTGTKNTTNGLFYVDSAGNVVMRNATMNDCSMVNAGIQGRLVTDSGSGVRTEIYDDGTYLVWIGSGSKTDVNGLFWIKRNGTGFIKGDFFSGQIIETKSGSANTTTGQLLANALGHNSAGKSIQITCSGSARGRATGGDYSAVILYATGTVYRWGNVIGSITVGAAGVYDAEINRTEWFLNFPTSVSETPGAGTQNYQFEGTFAFSGSVPNFTYIQRNASIRTFENKLE